MKPAIVFLSIFFLSVVISCTLQKKNGGKLEHTVRGKLQNDTPVFNPGIIVPGPKVPESPGKKDTVYHSTTQVVKVLDTAGLMDWFKNMQAEAAAADQNHNQEASLLEVIQDYRKALDQNKALFLELMSAKKNKEKAETKAEVTEKAIYDVPTYMYCILVLCIIFILTRQQVLKVKLEKQINALRAAH